jgi:hypothetical protein
VTPPRNQRGIALPVTIFIITLMTITLAAAFARVGAEREMAVGAGEAISALTVAQSGLQRYVGSRTSRPPDGDSVRFNVTGGYADVVARIVESDSLDDRTTMYVVRSTGYVIVPALGGTAQGKRTVAQFAQWQVGEIRRLAAFVAANGLTDQTGGEIEIFGTDQCGGVIPTGSVRTTSGPALNDGTYTPVPIRSGNGDAVADTTGINWAAIVNGDFLADESTLITGQWANKSYLVRGNATLAAGTWGQGLLIVTGDLTTTGGGGQWARWYGVILVGGRIMFNANRTEFRGMVVSGLNEQLGGAPPPAGTIGGGGGSARYHVFYCADDVNDVIAPLTGLAPIRNAWVDNWASY